MSRFLFSPVSLLIVVLLAACGDHEDAPPIETIRLEPIPAITVAEFSGQKAFDHIAKITAFGPRPPGSEGYRKSLAYLVETLAALGWQTRRRTFQAATPVGQVTFTNLLARHAPDQDSDWTVSTNFLIGGHLDTKLMPDTKFLGVNDSGSSTGVLLELARVLAASPGAAGNVELIFFDGEEAFKENIVRGKDGLYGSLNFAKSLRKRKTLPGLGIVLDLVGDPSVPLMVGADSHPGAVAQTRQAAATLDLENSLEYSDGIIIDDQWPLVFYARIPVLHLIGDFESMPYWHTPEDTLDKITPAALENTGKLTLQILHQMTN